MGLGMGVLVQEQPQGRFGIPWWGWFLLFGLVILVAVIWVLRDEGQGVALKEEEPEEATEPGTKAETVALAVEAVPPPPGAPDDLKRIEGIGPKISAILQAAGISTFAQLAATDAGRLQAILTAAGISRITDPSTWPDQARLAAAGDWVGLEAFQDGLKGGRHR
jgi:predicted flap endonuclease-1-like 5' DNA nuclease